MKILEDLGIVPKKASLYKTAFTHTSYANEHGVPSYERLEYLGDAILEFIMSDYLYRNTTHDEGMMTKMRAHYVCETALYEYSMQWNLNEYLRLGHGESENGGKFRKAIVADIYEAFIGALFLDQGIEAAKDFIYKSAIPCVEENKFDFFNDYKSKLQELVQTDQRSLEYSIIKEEGPSHKRTFTAIVKIDNILYGEGTAHSKKEAEQEAAKNALEKSVSFLSSEQS